MASPAIAIMIPTYNGGTLLRETVESCHPTVPGTDDDAILVADNGSDDGSVAALPERNAQGLRILRHSNPENLGRIGNWNQVARLARDAGFRYGAYLFVGDLHLPGPALGTLLRAMDASNAMIGLAPNCFLREDRSLVATAARVGITTNTATLPSHQLLRIILEAGALLLGPLQANVFRLDVDRPLAFDPATPAYTDQLETVRFMVENPGPATICAQPFMGWRAHAKRFHMTMNLEPRIRNDLAFLQQAAAMAGVPIRWPAVHASMLLQYLNNWRAGREFALRDVAQVRQILQAEPGGIDYVHALTLVARKALRRRGLVHIDSAADPS